MHQMDQAAHRQVTSPARKSQRVITIHGVNPDRSWQQVVDRVLKPHFDHVLYDYHDYDSVLGPLRAVANIPFLVFSMILFAYVLTREASGQLKWLLISLGVICFVLSIVLAWLKRTGCATRLKTAIAPFCTGGQRPNLIAHSLGTYLVGSILKYPDARFENVLLVSTVLPRRYPWKNLLTRNPRSVRHLRSEFGKSDYVVRTVGYLSWLVRDLGNAGLRGFHELENWVHTTLSPTQGCFLCSGRYVPVPVHNVPLLGFAHSGQFLGPEHAKLLWLPFLWNIGIDEFDDYLHTCLKISTLEDDERFGEVDKLVRDLWSRTYSWSNGGTLSHFIREEIVSRVRRGRRFQDDMSVDQVLRATKSILHRVTVKAAVECDRSAEIDEWVAQGLHPAKAVVRSLNFFDISDE